MKKIASINDLSGIGRCSLTVSLPIISALKVQCCPFPTAILSSQTGYREFSFLDLTNEMNTYKNVWKNLNLDLDFIYSGFLGSKNQIKIVSDFIDENENALVLVDPILGDNLMIYPVFDNDMCNKIKDLVKKSDITTPNLTEALILTNKELKTLDLKENEILEIAKEISELGPNKVVITGIVKKNKIMNLGYDKKTKNHFFTCNTYNNKSYSGTGDIFSSILSGMIVRGFDFEYCVNTASNFISKVVDYTSKFDIDRNDGIMFELFLDELTKI